MIGWAKTVTKSNNVRLIEGQDGVHIKMIQLFTNPGRVVIRTDK